MEENQLTEVAMNVILAAGDARDCCTKALQKARKGDFAQAETLMEQAHENIVHAHNAQTEVIQGEARGEKTELCLLFVHAQDTMMTIMSELNMAGEMIEMYKLIYNKEA